MGLPGPHAGARVHPPDRRRPLRRRLHGELALQRLPRHPRPHLRPSLRAGLPPRPGREGPGRDLPAQARRRRQQGRYPGPAARPRRGRQRQAGGGRRRRPRLAHRRPRPAAARLPRGPVRPRHARRRHDPHPDPPLPPARERDRRGGGLHPGAPARAALRRRGREPEGAARRGLRRRLHRQRRPARPRPRRPRPGRGRRQHPHRHRLALERLLRPRREHRPPRDRPGRRQHRHGLLPHRAPPGRRGGAGRGAQRLRGDEGVAVGEGGRDARGHPDPQLPRAQGLHPRGRPPHRRPVREGRAPLRQRPPRPRAHRRARRPHPGRRRPGRHRPGERLPLDRARRRPQLRPSRHAGRRPGHDALDPPQGVLRRRRRVRAQEHHLGRRARPRGRGLDRPPVPRPGPSRPPAAGRAPRQPEDGHPRVELRQRGLAR